VGTAQREPHRLGGRHQRAHQYATGREIQPRNRHSLGFAWAGMVVGAGTQVSYHSALCVCVGIGIVAFGASLILKPRAAASPARIDAGLSPAQVPA
jgi:hypothetical protein